VFLASRKNLCLVRNVLEFPQDTVISFDKPKCLVLDARLLAEIPHKNGQLAQIVSRNTREQVVYRLEMETTMEEVQPFGTRYIHSSAQLSLSKDLSWAKVGCACAPVRQCDLDLQRQSGHMAHK
jgi:hypothetical protein